MMILQVKPPFLMDAHQSSRGRSSLDGGSVVVHILLWIAYLVACHGGQSLCIDDAIHPKTHCVCIDDAIHPKTHCVCACVCMCVRVAGDEGGGGVSYLTGFAIFLHPQAPCVMGPGGGLHVLCSRHTQEEGYAALLLAHGLQKGLPLVPKVR